MVLRIALFLSMALGLLGLAGVGWIATHNDPAPVVVAGMPVVPQAAPPPVTRAVLVAAKALHPGLLLRPEDVTAQEIASGDLPADAIASTPARRSDLVGAMVRLPLTPMQPIEAAAVMLPGDHGFLAAVLQPGMRGATVAVDAVSGSAGLLWPGDRIDLLLTQALEDPKLPAGRRLAGEILLQDLRIVAVDTQLVRGAAVSDGPLGAQQAARTITLEVTPEQAERIAVASRIGKLAMMVRAAGDAEASDAAAKAGTFVAPAPTGRTTWAGDVSRALDPKPGDGKQGDGAVMRVFLGSGDGKEFHFQ